MKPLLAMPLRTSTLFLIFGAFVFTGLAAGSLASMWMASAFWGLGPEQLSAALENPAPEHARMLLLLNSVSQICTFLLPALFFMLLFLGGNGIGRPSGYGFYLWAGALWVISSSPLVDAASWVNQALIPAGSWLEQMALPAEEHAMRLVRLFLGSPESAGLTWVVIAVAVVPAICEEFAFRGVLQPLLLRQFSNPHVAIWLTALMFSLIHMQLYGFIPRLLLGAIMGYLVWWSGSLWPALVAHLANNAMGILVFRMTGGQMELPAPWWTQVILALLFLSGFWYFVRNNRPRMAAGR
jgi:uncharacterized protein